MLKGLTCLPALAVVAVFGLAGVATAAPDASTVVARVNGEEITLGHIIVARASLPEQYQQIPSDLLYDGILDQLIQQSALRQSRKGDTPLHVELSLENERRSLLAAEVIEKIMESAASDADIQAEYDRLYGDGFGADEFDASHILVETEDEAKALVVELENGADFAELAKQKSTGPTGPAGGALGWFGAGQMVPEFEEAVMAMEPGTISEPIQTQFGWHVIRLNDKRRSEAPALDDVREELAGDLRKQAVADRIEQLTSQAEIERPEIEEFDPEIIKEIGLIRN